jgi:hypothetical protein
VVDALLILRRAGSERVQVRLAARDWAPAEEVIWLVVPLIVMVVAGSA